MKKTTAKKSTKAPKPAYLTYSKEEKNFYKKLMVEMTQMRDAQRVGLMEFDGKTFLQAYDQNRKADLGYNEWTDDPSDYRVTTATTREKGTSVHSTLLKLKYDANIKAFDKENNMISEIGEQMEALVNKSRELEYWDAKRDDVTRELIAQGVVYVEEVYTERCVKKHDTDWMPGDSVSSFKADNAPLYDVEGMCEAKLHLGKYVLFSNWNEKNIQRNAIVATYEEVDRSVAESVYGTWDRWDMVPDEVPNDMIFSTVALSEASSGSDYRWNIYPVGKGKVGITKIYYREENRFMIILNGVMMLPVDFPLTKISPSGLIPIAKGTGETIPNFAIGKGIPAKTRVDQKLYDTLWRMTVAKALQSFNPTMGSRTNNVLSRDIVKSGQIIHGIKQNDIFPILPPQLLQVTGSDINMLEMAKSIISEKSVTDAYAAQTSSSDQTATEILNQQKQTLLKLVAFTDGYRLLEQQLVLLRIYNIIAHWTEFKEVPVFNDIVEVIDGVSTVTGKEFSGKMEKKYKTFSTKKAKDMTDEYSVISFVGNDTPLPTPREQQQYEDDVLAKKYGKNARQVYINAEWLRSLRCIWNIGVIQRVENDSQTELLMYLDNIGRIANIVGPQNLNMPHVMQRIAGRLGESAEKLFVQTEQSQMDQARQMMEEVQASQPKRMKPIMKNPATQTVNSWTGLGKAKPMLE
jgi:hypothetical protein